MATLGCLNNTNTNSSITGSGDTLYVVGGTAVEAGTITGLYIYGANRNASSTFNDAGWAIYKGGISEADPEGATLLWNSRRYLGIALGVSTTEGWYQPTDASSVSASGSFAASDILWVVFRSNDGFVHRTCDGADEGDFGPTAFVFNAAAGGSGPEDAWPAAIPATPSGSAETLKVRIEYTASAPSSVIPVISSFLRMMQNS